jgi:predicted cobalt transporter CbtA
MVRTFLVRGMLVGIVAGLLSFGFLKVYGEPQVERAIAFESQHDAAKEAPPNAASHHHDHGSGPHDHATLAHDHTSASHDDAAASHDESGAPHDHAAAAHHHGTEAADHEEELVSRPVQAGLGLLVGVLVYSAAFGGLFGLAFAFAYGRTATALTPQALAVMIAITGFVAIYLVPSLKYPANPPAVGEPETIGVRTALYFVMIAISLAAMIVSLSVKRLFLERFGEWGANLAVAACYIVLVAIAGFVLPSVNEVPEQFPATVLWNFRLASIGAQLVMWATLGLLFGALSQRAAAHQTQL